LKIWQFSNTYLSPFWQFIAKEKIRIYLIYVSRNNQFQAQETVHSGNFIVPEVPEMVLILDPETDVFRLFLELELISKKKKPT
jgi:hypothetical protein